MPNEPNDRPMSSNASSNRPPPSGEISGWMDRHTTATPMPPAMIHRGCRAAPPEIVENTPAQYVDNGDRAVRRSREAQHPGQPAREFLRAAGAPRR
jgi:hypothetical protein